MAKDKCGRCGDDNKKLKPATVAGPSPEAGSWAGLLCSECITLVGAKVVK